MSGVRPVECGVGLLDVLEPGWRVELVEDDLARKFDQRYGYGRRILARDHDACTLVPHLSHDFDKASHEVGALDVLVGLVEDDQLVERRFPVCRSGIREQLEQDHEESEGLILLDELVAQVDDDEPARVDQFAQAGAVVDVLRSRGRGAHVPCP